MRLKTRQGKRPCKRLIEEAEKANLELDTMAGEPLQKTVEGLFDVSPEVVAKAAALSK